MCCSWIDWCLYWQTSWSFYVLTIPEREPLKVWQEFPNLLCLYTAALETFHLEKLWARRSCKSDVEYMSFINWSVVAELRLFVRVFAQIQERDWISTPEGNTTNYCIFCFDIIVVVVSVTCPCMWGKTFAVRLFVFNLLLLLLFLQLALLCCPARKAWIGFESLYFVREAVEVTRRFNFSPEWVMFLFRWVIFVFGKTANFIKLWVTGH